VLHTVSSDFFLTLHAWIKVDRHQEVSTNPKKQGKTLLFVMSLRY